MWPFREPLDIVRVGRERVERWRPTDGELALVGQASLVRPDLLRPHPDDLEVALAGLFTQGSSQRVMLVLESAWLPVVLLDNGTRLLSTPKVHALARHRLGRYRETEEDPVADWTLLVDHRAGERYSLAYGLPARVHAALQNVALSRGVKWSSLVPTLDWAIRRHARCARRWGANWYVLVEQDRLIMLRTQADRAIGLHPGEALSSRNPHVAEVIARVAVQEYRLGLPPEEGVVMLAHWPDAQLQGSHPRVAWASLGAPAASQWVTPGASIAELSA